MKWPSLAGLALAVAVSFSCSPIPRPGSWQTEGTVAGLAYVQHLLRLADGDFMAIGEASPLNPLSKPAAAIFDVTTNSWRPAAGPPGNPFGETATALQDGTVLLAGGGRGQVASAAAYLYEPGPDKWIAVGSMLHVRYYHAASLLLDGRVLVVGGEDGNESLASCEVYDPRSRTWHSASSLPLRRVYHSALTLSDGRVMVAGGDVEPGSGGGFAPGTSPGSFPFSSEEIYSPTTDSWSELKAPQPVEDPNLLLLRDGQVLFTGGHFGRQPSNFTFLYDPRSGNWAQKGPAKGAGAAVELADGRVLFPQALQTYDPIQDLWMPVTQPPADVVFPAMPVLRPDGKVLTIASTKDFPQHEVVVVFDANGFPPLPGSTGPLADPRAPSLLFALMVLLGLLIAVKYLAASRK